MRLPLFVRLKAGAAEDLMDDSSTTLTRRSMAEPVPHRKTPIADSAPDREGSQSVDRPVESGGGQRLHTTLLPAHTSGELDGLAVTAIMANAIPYDTVCRIPDGSVTSDVRGGKHPSRIQLWDLRCLKGLEHDYCHSTCDYGY